jgi:hypothetical protein
VLPRAQFRSSADIGQVRIGLDSLLSRRAAQGYPLLANLFSIFSQPQNNLWKTPIGLLLVPSQRQFSQYKFAVELIQSQVEEQSAPEL